MTTHKLFLDFNSKIQLNDSKVGKLRISRNALREKIREYFKKNSWEVPKFSSQGSFPLNTNLNPIKQSNSDGEIIEVYDLDDGVYIICPEEERKTVDAYHSRIKNAVEGHAKSIIDKTTCIRVVYSDGHHIDLPIYWMSENSPTPQLAHKSKGFIDSDPKSFKEWVEDKLKDSNSNGQLRRIIRYLKAWKEFRENCNSTLNLPSGFILTILACKHFQKNDNDALSLKLTLESIKTTLELSFTCYRPTVPTQEDLLSKYSKSTVIPEISSFIEEIQKTVDSECDKESSKHCQKVFGDRFPLGKAKESKSIESYDQASVRTKVSSPWLSY